MFQDNYCGVYRITVATTGQSYVGSAQNMVSRQARHLKDLQAGKHHNRHLQEAFNLYGTRSLVFEVVQVCSDRQAAYLLEAEILSVGLPLLNIGQGARGGDNLTQHPERSEIIRRMQVGLAAAIAAMSGDQRQRTYGRPGKQNGMYRQTHGPEIRQILSRFHAGNQYARGTVRSEAQRKAMSARASQRTGESNPFYGRSHSPETKAKISATKSQLPRVLPTNSQKLVIEGTTYLCIKDAMRATGLSRFVIKRRLADPAFPHYQEIE